MAQPLLIYAGMPLHNGYCHHAAARSLYFGASKKAPVIPFQSVSSLLPGAFNMLICYALNQVKKGATHFAMIHGDVVAPAGWVDCLIEEMKAHDADVMSAVVAIKNDKGSTSVAIGDEEGYPRRFVRRRLTLKELESYPETFSIADTPWPDKILLVNTGLWVMDIRAAWVRRWALAHAFHMESWIEENEQGELTYGNVPEDWNFSRDVHRMGRKVMATRKVPVNHAGEQMYPNYGTWGTAETDLIWEQPKIEPQQVEQTEPEPALA